MKLELISVRIFCEFQTPFKPFFVGILKVQEETSERTEKVPGRYMDGTLKVCRVTYREREREGWIGYRVVVCVCVCACVRACAYIYIYIYMGGECCTYLLS